MHICKHIVHHSCWCDDVPATRTMTAVMKVINRWTSTGTNWSSIMTTPIKTDIVIRKRRFSKEGRPFLAPVLTTMYAAFNYLLSSFLFLLSALALPQTQTDTIPTTLSAEDGLKVLQCTFSCPLQDNQGHGLILKMDGVGYDGVYSIFECMYVVSLTPLPSWRIEGANFLRYAAPNAFDEAKTCWYYKVQSALMYPPFLFFYKLAL